MHTNTHHTNTHHRRRADAYPSEQDAQGGHVRGDPRGRLGAGLQVRHQQHHRAARGAHLAAEQARGRGGRRGRRQEGAGRPARHAQRDGRVLEREDGRHVELQVGRRGQGAGRGADAHLDRGLEGGEADLCDAYVFVNSIRRGLEWMSGLAGAWVGGADTPQHGSTSCQGSVSPSWVTHRASC